MKHLIVTTDDFGAHEYIDRGVKEAILKKCVNTVSCIVTFDQSETAILDLIQFIKNNSLDVNIGIHISLTAGSPVLKNGVNSLIDDNGKFMSVDSYDYIKTDPFEVFKEVDGQIDKMNGICQSEGMKLDHLSCHHGIMNIFPDYLKIYLLLAAKYHVPVRNPTLISRENIRGFRLSSMKREGLFRALKIIGEEGVEQVIINAATISVGSLYRSMKVFNGGIVEKPDHFIDTFYKNGGKKRLKKILKKMPDNSMSELVVHLGQGKYDDSKTEQEKYNGINFKYFPGREKELETITQKLNIFDYITHTSNIDFSSFSQL